MPDAEMRTLEETMELATQFLMAENGLEAPYDINCGLCQDWVDFVMQFHPDAGWLWLDEAPVPEDDQVSHICLVVNGRYYDAECPEGVADYRDLPIYRNQGKLRQAVIAARDRKEVDAG